MARQLPGDGGARLRAGGTTTLDADEPAGPTHDGDPGRSIGQNVGARSSSQVFTWLLSPAWVWIAPRCLGSQEFGAVPLAGDARRSGRLFRGAGTSSVGQYGTRRISRDTRQ